MTYIADKIRESMEDLLAVLTTSANYPAHITALKTLPSGRVFIGFSPKYDYPNIRIEPGDIPMVSQRTLQHNPHIIVETLGRGDDTQVKALTRLVAEVIDVILDPGNRRTAHDWNIVPGVSVRTGLYPAPGRKGLFLRWSDIALSMTYGGDWYE